MTNTEPALTLDAATALRFPPFPEPPEGVTLIPFTAFRPSGIRVPIEDDDYARAGQVPELDGLGIPTIALRVKHVADTSEKKKKRKKKSGGAQSVQVAPERPKMWWEVWEDFEDIRRNAYDENEKATARLVQAGEDFKNGRTWPTAQHGIQQVWDIYRIYIGLLEHVPGPPQGVASSSDPAPPADADARSDDGDTDEGEADSSDDQDEESRLASFLNDPELSMKIFFSSYFREKGLVWSEPRCQATPILVSFFLRYLIRSCVFPEPKYEGPMERALAVTELARIELPNSWKLGKALPDAFSDGCRGLWGSMQSPWVPPPPADPSPDSINEPGAKRQRMDEPEGSDADMPGPSSPDKTFADSTAELNPEILGDDDGWGTAMDGVRDFEGWGPPGGGWDDAHHAHIEDHDEDGNPIPVPSSETLPPIIDAAPTWDLAPPTLLPLLGPSALPLTHTTGVVEQSTRRIVRVEPPRAPRILAMNAPAAEAVEEDLACRFARVVLAPWDRLEERAYKGSDVLPPAVLNLSRGDVVLDDEGENEASAGAHRPWKDEIGVLVDPKVADVFVEGMGLGAIWVEIVRDTEGETGVPSSSLSSTSKKGKGKKKEVPKYWYMEQLVHQLPSFYIDKPYIDKPELSL